MEQQAAVKTEQTGLLKHGNRVTNDGMAMIGVIEATDIITCMKLVLQSMQHRGC